MSKIKETRFNTDGAAGPRTQTRVRELAEGEEKPENATEVEAETPTHDWKNEAPAQ